MVECFLCEDCGSVCESHPERPWRGVYACGCGSAGAPCPSCNRPDGGVPGSSFSLDEYLSPPRSPLPNAATAAQHGRRHMLLYPLLALGTLIATGYVTLVWFTNASTRDRVAMSGSHVAIPSNENVPSLAERCMPIGLNARGDLTFPLKCQELRDRLIYSATEVRPELAPAVRPEQVDHAFKMAGSGQYKSDMNSRSKSSDERSGLNPTPPVKAARDSSQAIEENRALREVWQSSRILKDRRQRFAELINHPLARNCINCLLFGY
jgi:hypothetical protein